MHHGSARPKSPKMRSWWCKQCGVQQRGSSCSMCGCSPQAEVAQSMRSPPPSPNSALQHALRSGATSVPSRDGTPGDQYRDTSGIGSSHGSPHGPVFKSPESPSVEPFNIMIALEDEPIPLLHSAGRPSLPSAYERFAEMRDDLMDEMKSVRDELIVGMKAEMQGWKLEMETELRNYVRDLKSKQFQLLLAEAAATSGLSPGEETDKWHCGLKEELHSYVHQIMRQEVQLSPVWDHVNSPHPNLLEVTKTTTEKTPHSKTEMTLATLQASARKAIATGSEQVDMLEDLHGGVVREFQKAYSSQLHKGSCVVPLLRAFYLLSRILVSLGVWLFLAWGLYKIMHPDRYVEIRREGLGWTSGEMPIPDVGFTLTGEGDVVVSQCIIRDGNYSTKSCQESSSHPCKANSHASHCLNPDFRLLGTWGDPVYKYVEIHFSVPTNVSSDRNGISLSWTQRLTLFNIMILERLYSFDPSGSQAYEIFFQKVHALEGTWFGFAGHHGNDESENWLDQQMYLRHAHEYSRQMVGSDMRLFLRADAIEVEEFYEYYSVLRMLEALGGLWTALSAVMAAVTLTLMKAYTRGKQASVYSKDVVTEIVTPRLTTFSSPRPSSPQT